MVSLQYVDTMLGLGMEKKFDIARVLTKFREDIAIANPVAFLVRAMNGEEFDGEKLGLRDRVDIAKVLAGRIVPSVAPEERGLAGDRNVMPPPLTIIMHAGRKEKVDTFIDVGDDKNTIKEIFHESGNKESTTE